MLVYGPRRNGGAPAAKPRCSSDATSAGAAPGSGISVVSPSCRIAARARLRASCSMVQEPAAGLVSRVEAGLLAEDDPGVAEQALGRRDDDVVRAARDGRHHPDDAAEEVLVLLVAGDRGRRDDGGDRGARPQALGHEARGAKAGDLRGNSCIPS